MKKKLKFNIMYKVIDFAVSYISKMANKLPSTNLNQFLRRIETPLLR